MIVSKEKIKNLVIDINYLHNRTATPDWYIAEEQDFQLSLVVIYDGKGTFETRGEKRRVGAGDVVLFCDGDSKYMNTDKDNLLKFYTTNFICALPEYSDNDRKWTIKRVNLPFDFVTHINDKKTFEHLIHLFEKMCRIYATRSETYRTDVNAVFFKILNIISNISNAKQGINYMVKLNINRVLEYMYMHSSDKLTLKKLAKISNMSIPYFSSTFKKVTGRSPMEHLNYLRIENAKQLLKYGKKVKAVAEEVGFSDIYYFSKTFKKYENLSPKQYALHVLNPNK